LGWSGTFDDEQISKIEALVLALYKHLGPEVPSFLLGFHRTGGDGGGHPKKNNGFLRK
jgi:hypothetical protein